MERPNDRVVALHVHIFYPISSFNAQMPTWYFLINLMLFENIQRCGPMSQHLTEERLSDRSALKLSVFWEG